MCNKLRCMCKKVKCKEKCCDICIWNIGNSHLNLLILKSYTRQITMQSVLNSLKRISDRKLTAAERQHCNI